MIEKSSVNNDHSLFEKIIAREIDCDFIMENEGVFCFKDISPQAPKHYLMVPKTKVSQLNRVHEAEEGLEQAALCFQTLMSLGEKEKHEHGYGICVNNGVGAMQTVFHLHFHFLAGRQMQVMNINEKQQRKQVIKSAHYTLTSLAKPIADMTGPNIYLLRLNEKISKGLNVSKEPLQPGLEDCKQLIEAVIDASRQMVWQDFRMIAQSQWIIDQQGHLSVVLTSGEGMVWPPF